MFKTLLSVCLPAWFAIAANAGQMVGNGGDALRLRFFKAKEFAATVVLKAQEQGLRASASAEIRDFLVKNQEALAADLIATEHVWVEDERVTCARTLLEPAAQLILSYPTCRGLKPTLKEIATLLIHESIHHLGISDETFADSASIALMNAWEKGELQWFKMAPVSFDFTGRRAHSIVWNGEKALIFGGIDVENQELSTGAIYDRKKDSWKKMSSQNAPSRYGHQAVWHQGKMIVWGGYEFFDGDRRGWVAEGAIYDLEQDSWSKIPTPPKADGSPGDRVLDPRVTQTATLIGNQLMVWGGEGSAHQLPVGGLYDLKTGLWKRVSDQGAPVRKGGHAAVQMDGKVMIWGGNAGRRNYSKGGAIYDLASESWKQMTEEKAPFARAGHAMVWTGKKVVMFGGDYGSGRLQGSGGIYDPVRDTWTLFESELASQRTGHILAWSGDELLIFGGQARRSTTVFGTPLAYDPDSDSWRVLTAKGGPGARFEAAGVWADDVWLIFGGKGSLSEHSQSGAMLYP